MASYFLLCGYTPFDRDSQYEEMQAICNGDYKFEPVSCRTRIDVVEADSQAEYWQGVSDTAREFVRACLTIDPTNRPTADELLTHPWLKADASDKAVDLLPNVKAAFDAKKTCKSAAMQLEAG
jgi:serine/threonine protein kinase